MAPIPLYGHSELILGELEAQLIAFDGKMILISNLVTTLTVEMPLNRTLGSHRLIDLASVRYWS